MKYHEGIPCPDPSLPAGLSQRDIDRALDPDAYAAERAERYEREMERADRMRDEEKDRRAEEKS